MDQHVKPKAQIELPTAFVWRQGTSWYGRYRIGHKVVNIGPLASKQAVVDRIQDNIHISYG